MVGLMNSEEERYTFSSLITSLIGMEGRIKEFYELTSAATERSDQVAAGRICERQFQKDRSDAQDAY